MNYCDYYVVEVFATPRHTKFVAENKTYEWWEIEVSYYYDNGELKTRWLSFDTQDAARGVKKGYHFLA